MLKIGKTQGIMFNINPPKKAKTKSKNKFLSSFWIFRGKLTSKKKVPSLFIAWITPSKFGSFISVLEALTSREKLFSFFS